MRTTWLRIDSSSCFHSSSNVKHSSEDTIWLNKHFIWDNQHIQDGINKTNTTLKLHIRITLSAEFSSEENSFHSKNVSGGKWICQWWHFNINNTLNLKSSRSKRVLLSIKITLWVCVSFCIKPKCGELVKYLLQELKN